MSSNNGKPVGRPSYGANPQQRRESKLASAPCTADDARHGDYNREQLLKMHERFCASMTRAIERALERVARAEREADLRKRFSSNQL